MISYGFKTDDHSIIDDDFIMSLDGGTEWKFVNFR